MRDRKACIKRVTVIAEGEDKELPMDKRLQRILEVSLAVLAVVVIAGIAKAQTQKPQPAEAVMAEATQENGITYGEEKNTEPERDGKDAADEAKVAENTGRTGAGGKASVGIEAEILDELLREPDEGKATQETKESEADDAKTIGSEAEQEEDEEEYASLAIANVSNYVNVRSEPDTEGEIVGKIYDGAVAQIQSVAGEDEDWFCVVSGNVEGYIKAEYFIYGEAAADVVDRYVTRYATVRADRLNVRKEPSTDADRIGYIDQGEKVRILENGEEWLKVQYTEQRTGYVAAEYVTVSEEFVYAKTLEEEQAELEAQKALEERQEQSEQEAPELVSTVTPPETTYTSNEELRKGIVDYAMQYLGNKYVHGGSSLAGGTDCSGFTCLVYAQFGYSISRTPGGQYSSAGRSISQEELQPGDIVCYSSNGGKSCTHVGFYIGNGQILHSANSRKGVIISDINYSPVIGMRNVID